MQEVKYIIEPESLYAETDISGLNGLQSFIENSLKDTTNETEREEKAFEYLKICNSLIAEI